MVFLVANSLLDTKLLQRFYIFPFVHMMQLVIRSNSAQNTYVIPVAGRMPFSERDRTSFPS